MDSDALCLKLKKEYTAFHVGFFRNLLLTFENHDEAPTLVTLDTSLRKFHCFQRQREFRQNCRAAEVIVRKNIVSRTTTVR